MRFLPLVGVVGLIAVGQWTAAQAQDYWGGDGYPYLYRYGFGYGYHTGTAAESAARGMANLVRSMGEANLMNSMAARNYEAARAQYLDNRLKYTKTYFEMKQYNRDYRDATKAPRPTAEQLFRLAKDATPKPLTPDQLDPVTGRINWPEVLTTGDFDRCRKALDALYAARADAGGKINLDEYRAIEESIREMQDLLREKLGDLPPRVFTSANAFIRQLQYAAQLKG